MIRFFQSLKELVNTITEFERHRKILLDVKIMKQASINSKINFDTKDLLCVICRNIMEPAFSKILSCGHIYHTKCLTSWLKRQFECPVCRSKITSSFTFKSKKHDMKTQSLLKSVACIIGLDQMNFKKNNNMNSNEMTVFKSLPTLNPLINDMIFWNNNKKERVYENISHFNKIQIKNIIIDWDHKTNEVINKFKVFSKKNERNF